MSKLLILLLTFTFLACEQQEEEQVVGLTPNARWDKSRLPLKLSLSSNFDDDEINAINDMADNWNQTYEKDFFQVNAIHTAKTSVNPDNLNDSTMGIYKLAVWPDEFPRSALAVTQLFGEEKNGKVVIGHADILINYEHYNFTTDYSFGYDLATVVLHEMGHYLGLKHFKGHRDDSVMYPSITRFTDKRSPTVSDEETISSLYDGRSSQSVQQSGKFNIRIRQALMPGSCTKAHQQHQH
jgi:predicted Zn-dependent protease